MKVLGLWGVILLTAAGFAQAELPEEFLKRWAAAVDENAVEKLMSFYERSEDTELIVSAGLRYEGFDAIKEVYEQTLGNVAFYDSEALKLKARLIGEEAAIVSFEHRFKGRELKGKRHFKGHIRTTTFLKKKDGKWMITLEHSSPIQGTERMQAIEK